MASRLRAWRARALDGAPLYPLAVLFGLNAADELDRTAFGVLLPNIRDDFGLDNQGVLSLVALAGVAVILLSIPVAFLADRVRRVRVVAVAAAVWAAFSLGTGLALWVWLLIVTRAGSGLARAVNDPAHNSLIADYYEPDVRPKAYGWHRAANSVGQFLGPVLAGGLAWAFGWRAPFVVFAIPTAAVIIAATRLREPSRGAHERRLAGADADVAATEEAPPSFAEAWRIVLQVRTLRRIWASLPFLALTIVGLNSLTSLYYEDVFSLSEVQRGMVAAVTEPFQIVGIVLGVPIAARLLRREAGLALKFLAIVGAVGGVLLGAFALAPNLGLAIALNIVFAGVVAILGPGIQASVSLAIPPKVRTLGFAVGAVWMIPGLAALGVVGRFGDTQGMRAALLLLVPVFVVGATILASAGSFVASDIQRIRSSSLAQSAVRAARDRGQAKLLLVKDLDVAYGHVQVLFGVDFEVGEGEVIALLGTNGAGKSTLLRAISGLAEPAGGAIVFDGRDMTYAPPNEVSARGVVQVPGGKGVFPTLSVEENLRIAAWLYRKDKKYVKDATERVFEYFPVLRERIDQPAGNLSGGQQQMLTLGMAFLAKPRLLMIDELSLGLAPVIVEQLLHIVRAIRDQGTTVILVEQSVNVALTVAETAYFMEKGEIRFRGPTADLLRRPDVLRSVFLEGASVAVTGRPVSTRAARMAVRERTPVATAERRPLLRVEGVSKAFGGIVAVRDVSFDLEPGEVLGIIGPNGAGKTTLFDLVSGFERVDRGSVLLGERDVTHVRADGRARLGLGRSFQDARLFPSLTVEETIAVALERHRAVKDPLAESLLLPAAADDQEHIATRASELIDMLGLGAFRDKFVADLSTGSRRIVDLACVLAHEPAVVLFDEPSSGIAQRETEALGPLLLRVREQTGASLLVIEHDMPLITSVADEILALDLGEVVVRDTPAAVVSHPRVVASYLGEDESVIRRSGDVGKDVPSSNGARPSRRRDPLRAASVSPRAGQGS